MNFNLLIFFSLIFRIRLVFSFIIFFLFHTTLYSNDFRILELKDNNFFCVEHDCSIKKKNSQKLVYNYNSKVFELIEDGKLLRYYFYTTDIVYIPAYSLKPIDLLISLESNGCIRDLRLINHSEPIFLAGINIEKLLEAIVFYKGVNVKNEVDIGGKVDHGSKLARKIESVALDIYNVFRENNSFKHEEYKYGIPIIFGATATSFVLHDTILKSSRSVFNVYNMIVDDSTKGDLDYYYYEKISFNKLLDQGILRHYDIFKEDDNININLYYSNVSLPIVGKNILGEDGYCRLMKKYGYKKSIILVLNKKNNDLFEFWSFIGSAFVKGVYDRFFVKQGFNTYTFRYEDYRFVHDLDSIENDLKDFESGLFIIKDDKFKASFPFELVLFVNKNIYKDKEYEYPAMFYIPTVSRIHNIWVSNFYYVTAYLSFWISVIFIFLMRYKLSKNAALLNRIYLFILLLSVFFGLLNANQPSVVNILALIDNVSGANVFLLTPILAIGLVMMIITSILWGKSLFCGWICPFGALQEILFKFRYFFYKVFNKVTYSYEFHRFFRIYYVKLAYFRYFIVFFLIFCLFSFGIEYVEKISDYIEPFKTVWTIGVLNRSYYGFYAIFLLIVSFFMYRFFCRYLCPLGAILSLLSAFTVFRIRRRNLCKKCNVCSSHCNSYAITKDGRVDPKECFGCFNCINTMYDNNRCPELIYLKRKISLI